MKKRILMVVCTLVLFLMASGNKVLAAATGFEAPGDGDYVLIGKEVDINYLVGVTANNRQTYCKITIEAPDGETTEAFLSYDAYAGFMANTSFTPTLEGTYTITAECGGYINIYYYSSLYYRYTQAGLTETITVKAVRTLPTAAAGGQTGRETASKTGTKKTEKTGSKTGTSKKTKAPKKGTVLKKGGAAYVVLGDQKTVSYKGPASKSVKSVTIPATVKISGRTYRVTGIKAKAFSGCKNVKKVTVGKNVSSIGASAFKGCSKLKLLTIKSSKLKAKNIGAKAFSDLPGNGVVKVPKKNLKTYTKMLRQRGLKKNIKVKTY